MSTEHDQSHRVVRMRGRAIDQVHRGATTLELLFDLTFVIAFGVAANELAHALAEDHISTGIQGFCFATFAVSWAWINFTWFASAYDTDDWLYRLTTMVQMVGVLILALGLPDMFASLEEGEVLDNRVLVLGYVVMRVPMVFQWARAARQDPERRPCAQAYIVSILVAQIGWIVLLVLETSIPVAFAGAAVLILVELSGPVYAERHFAGTPWHPHHMAERYGLLVIIALGEGMIGTMASMTALVGPDGPGWSLDVVVVGLAGVALVFGMWWAYFVVPTGDVLAVHRERSFGWGYGHIPLFGAIVAVGAGLHVAAYYLEDHSELSALGTVVSVAAPLAVFVVVFFALYAQVTRTFDPFHLTLAGLSLAVVAASLLLALVGLPMPWCLVVLALTPWVTVVGYERRGHLANERLLASLRGGSVS